MSTLTTRRSIVYLSGIIGSLCLLAVLPILFTKRNFAYQYSGEVPPAPVFPIDLELPLWNVKQGLLPSKAIRTLLQDGQPALVNFWATWCPPCIEELPSLELLHQQLAEQNNPELPRLITISVDEQATSLTALYRTLDFTPQFTVLHDAQSQSANQVGTTRFPETYLVDYDGKILHKWIGPQDWLSETVLSTIKEHTGRNSAKTEKSP